MKKYIYIALLILVLGDWYLGKENLSTEGIENNKIVVEVQPEQIKFEEIKPKKYIEEIPVKSTFDEIEPVIRIAFIVGAIAVIINLIQFLMRR